MNQGYRYEHQVQGAGAGRSVLAYHTQHFPHRSAEGWRAEVEAGRIFRNGHRASSAELLVRGDQLVFERAPWNEPEVPLSFGVVYEDEQVLVVDKPAGLQVLPAGLFLEHTLLHQVRISSPARARSAAVHRLGRGTSGLVLFGKDAAARASFSAQLRDFRTTKTYLARVVGTGLAQSFIARQPIGPRAHGPMQVFAVDERGKASATRVRVLARDREADRSLVAAQPITGRPDQIRIHLAAAGAPIAGDPLFGAGGLPVSEARPGDGDYRLHAAGLSVWHPRTGARLKLRSSPAWLS